MSFKSDKKKYQTKQRQISRLTYKTLVLFWSKGEPHFDTEDELKDEIEFEISMMLNNGVLPLHIPRKVYYKLLKV